jgi:nucleoside-diphosphate-sugar epimerase
MQIKLPTTTDRILITGACGFTGRHLIGHLRRQSRVPIVATDVHAEPDGLLVEYYPCDLTDQQAVDRLVARAQPHRVYHLAGLMGGAGDDEIMRVNVGGFTCLTRSLREYAVRAGERIRLLTIGSAAELGCQGAARLPVREEAECQPSSAYGRSKLQVTKLALAEPAGSPLDILIARPFNLVGPGLSPQLSLGNFARQVAGATRGENNIIRCGPLDTRRDFVDVRDAAAAYCALMQDGRTGHLYNVCIGRSYRLGRLLDILITLANVKVRILSDASRARPDDLKDIYGDHSKITRDCGWIPTITIEHSLADLLAAA